MKSIGIDIGTTTISGVVYDDEQDVWKKWAKMGVLAVEMEAAALYMNAARYGAKALAMMTISDHFVTGEKLTPEEREQEFTEMIRVALGMLQYI